MNTELIQKVKDFLIENPSPTDQEFHDWAESIGVDPDTAETAAYRLAAVMAQFLNEGEAKEKGITKADVPAEELAQGTQVEHEHIKNDTVAGRIALDHLAESPKYYDALEEMEKSLKEAYIKGFSEHCEKRGVDAAEFLKIAKKKYYPVGFEVPGQGTAPRERWMGEAMYRPTQVTAPWMGNLMRRARAVGKNIPKIHQNIWNRLLAAI